MSKSKIKRLFLLVIVLLICGLAGVLVLNKHLESKKQAVLIQSKFSKEIEEAEKKAEEARKVEEEKKRKEEETKKFIATYGPCRTIPILMYHHIDNLPGWLYVAPAVFGQQMDYLVNKGYTTVTLPEIVAGLSGTGVLPAKPIVLTFDDGYRDFHSQAYPLLRQKNLKATVFIITQLMEGADYLTWEQARELAGNSLITVGDHTLDHRSMGKMGEDELHNEIINSKNIIDSRLGKTTNVFAYPFGTGNSQAAKILVEAGFAAAVTASRGLTCAKLPYGLSRIRIGNNSLSSYGL